MVDIQPAAAEIRRGKKEEDRRQKETTGQKYNGPLLHRAAIITVCALNARLEILILTSSVNQSVYLISLCACFRLCKST